MSCNAGNPYQKCTWSGGSGFPTKPAAPSGQALWDVLKDYEKSCQIFSRHLSFGGRRRNLPFVTLHTHAMKHKEARSIRRLYQQGKVVALFREGQNRYHCIVKLSRNFYGDYIIARRADGSWHEVSAFEVGVEWPDVLTWLRRKGNVQPHCAALPA